MGNLRLRWITMARRRKGTSQGFLSRKLDATISLLVRAMILSFIIGAGLVVASGFYEPAIGKWSIVLAAPYAVIIPMYFNLQYMGAGGNLLVDFFTVPMESAVTASLLLDLLIAFAAFNVLLFAEGRTLGARNFWSCVAVSWLVAFAAGLPLFLLLRERQQRLG